MKSVHGLGITAATPGIAFTFLEILVALEELLLAIERGDIEQPGVLAIARGIPVGCTNNGRRDENSLVGRFHTGNTNGGAGHLVQA